MEDIKHKFLDFISKQANPGKIPIVGRNFDDFEINKEVNVQPQQSKTGDESGKDAQSDREILESIQPEYFKEDGFDASLFELKKLPEELDGDQIEHDLIHLRKQQAVVRNQVLQLILEKQSACQEEFNRVVEVQTLVGCTLESVRRGRDDLQLTKEHFTTASLGILANYRKRTLVHDLLASLNAIKTLSLTEYRMQELLAAGDYSGAILLLVQCQAAATTYRHFSCVASLSTKLQDTLVMAEEQLDQTLAQICYNFDPDVYSKLQEAYTLLGKTQIAMDQLHMHFTSAIHNSAYKAVYEFTANDSVKKQYAHLCKIVPESQFITCLTALCKALWKIVLSYHQVVNWHQHHKPQMTPAEDESVAADSLLQEQYVEQKLESGLRRLWHDLQTRVSALVLAAQLTHYKFDEFLQLLAIVHRLEQIGEEFCGSESEELQKCVQTQSSNYFMKYHNMRVDELRIFLENEVWTPCPVRDDFSLLHLQEFRGLRNSLQQFAGATTAQVTSRSSGGSLDGSSIGGSFFSRYASSVSPFDTLPDIGSLNQEENILDVTNDPSGYFSEESDGENLDLNGGHLVSQRYRRRHEGTFPLLTNTTLTVLRHCGKYLQMSKLLRSNANDVVLCLAQLFDYYLFSVYSFFTSDPLEVPNGSLSPQLQATLKRIRDSLKPMDEDGSEYMAREPSMSAMVDLSSAENLFGLAERVVAVESLVFLAEQITFLKPYLHHLQPQSDTLHLLYDQSVVVASEVRTPVYGFVAWRVVDIRQTLSLMSRVNWEVKDVMSQHSSYVDFILRDLQIFSMRLEETSKHVTISKAVVDSLWSNLALQLAEIFVEGFASAKKCSNGGRALMQLDWTQLVSQVGKMCGLRPLPHRELVEAYVKAFYMPEQVLEAFVKDHTEYSSKQVLALVSCACQTNKKTRQRLIMLIEEQERAGIR